jgi:hypothetical protein
VKSFRPLIALVLTAAVACSGTPDAERSGEARWTPEAGPGATPEYLEGRACGLPREHLLRIWRGYHPERSGEIQIVPRRPNFVGAWLSHSGPWEYVQRVPLFFYGPGHVPAAGRVDRPATVADVAPTKAELMDFDFDAPDGHVLPEAVVPERGAPPKLILTLVWDSVGRNVLAEHPDSWPTLRSLIPQGTWFERATVGSSPSVTPAVHTTIGTGAFPRRHGLVDLRARTGEELRLREEVGPDLLLAPTLADVYDRAMGNAPLVGMVGPEGALGLVGHGSSLEGGDRDIVAISKVGQWIPSPGNAEYFRFPAYVRDVPGLDDAVRRLDLEDGQLDGRWLGEEVLESPGDIAQTPAYAEHQTRVLEEIIRREGFGRGTHTDLLFANYRQTDAVGHRWSMNSPQMEGALRASDQALGELIQILNREVGEGEWVIALTADHGSTPKPETTGAFVIDPQKLTQDIQATFGGGGRRVIENTRVTQIWMDVGQLEAGGHTLEEVAGFLAEYNKGQNASDPEQLPEEERDERLFEAAFPSSAFEGACDPRKGG